jgi:DNA-binding winged helix-turn-helix (wHTH) protein/tetratricopeptide (TPR) repeat protein
MGLPTAGYTFAGFRLDARHRVLATRTGERLPITPKAFDTLLYLVERAGTVVSKAAVMQAVWPDVQVEENSLSQCVSALRRTLGDDPKAHRFIATVPGRGYRFVAEVSPERGAPASLAEPDAVGRAALRSLAVLPFKPLGPDGGFGSLELGMTDALIMRIGVLRDIDLRPLSSVRRYGDVDQDPREAGRALGVDLVLDGAVQRHVGQLRASVRLLDVATGGQLWADRFDEPFSDIFGVQDRIAERVAGAVLPRLTRADQERLRKHPTENPDAYQLYVTGWSALTRPGGGNLRQALQHLEAATRLDPQFALAFVCVADCYALLGVFGVESPQAVFPAAKAAVMRALELDAELAEAYAELGPIYTVYDLEWPRAEAAYQRALEINPRSAMTHHYIGLQCLAYGRVDDALAAIRRAQALEPLAANMNANIGMVHYYAGRYEAAVAQLEATLQLDASFDHARSFLGRALLRLGEVDRAIAQFEGRTTATIAGTADLPVAYAMSGRRRESGAALERLLREAGGRYVSPFEIATIHAALQHPEQALDWLERAIDERSQPINFVELDPMFAGLRRSRRFGRLLRRLHRHE